MGLWDAAKAVGGAIGGAIKDGAEAIGDAAEEVAGAAEEIGDAGGWIANRACSIDGDIVWWSQCDRRFYSRRRSGGRRGPVQRWKSISRAVARRVS